MKLQVSSIVINKTHKYLLPCLLEYGEEFSFQYHKVWKAGVGIGDIITIKSNIQFEKHIFVLLDSQRNLGTFENFMIWVREQSMYEDDYAYDNLLSGSLHMLVLKLPEKFYTSYDLFKQSKYSKMYSVEQVNKWVSSASNRAVLIKDHNYKIEFAKQVKDRFGVDLKAEEIDDSFEFDFPLNEDEELFNTHLK